MAGKKLAALRRARRLLVQVAIGSNEENRNQPRADTRASRYCRSGSTTPPFAGGASGAGPWATIDGPPVKNILLSSAMELRHASFGLPGPRSIAAERLHIEAAAARMASGCAPGKKNARSASAGTRQNAGGTWARLPSIASERGERRDRNRRSNPATTAWGPTWMSTAMLRMSSVHSYPICVPTRLPSCSATLPSCLASSARCDRSSSLRSACSDISMRSPGRAS